MELEDSRNTWTSGGTMIRKLKLENIIANGFRIVFILIAVALTYFIFTTSPNVKFPLMLHKLSMVTVAAIVGYFLDYILFPNFRPSDLAKRIEDNPYPEDGFLQMTGLCNLRRAVIIVGMIIGVSQGV